MPFKKGVTPPGAKVFKKGQSGNLKGRPPELKATLIKILSEKKDDIDALEAILKSIRNKAIKGDVKAAEFIISRMYGKPDMHIDISGGMTNTIIQIIPDTNSHPIV